MSYFKRLTAVVLSLMILMSALCSVLTFNASAETITYVDIQANYVRIRTTPSTADLSNVIEQVSYKLTTLVESTYVDGYTWYKVTYHNGTQQITGYVRHADYTVLKTVTFSEDFEETLKQFPESYRAGLRELHAMYPNWVFVPDKVNSDFNYIVSLESTGMTKQVSMSSHPVSWRSMGENVYNWDSGTWNESNGGWTGASREITAYYMDPRNFLNNSEIYMFLDQSYNPAYQNELGVEKIVQGTFLARGYSDSADTAYGGSYVKVIMAAAQQSGVSPYIIASKIIQEQGVNGTSSLISGTTSHGKYFNFFNINASGSTNADVVANGLAHAKNKGWTTRSASIIGGAQFLSNGYISAGQNTYYYQDFNVKNLGSLWHQYAQAIHDARSKGASSGSTYKTEYDYALNFLIPIYNNMPESPSPKPVQSSAKNNYYFNGISASGLSPSFYRYTYNYSLSVSGNSLVQISLPDGASLASSSKILLRPGKQNVTLKVRSQTGYTNDYNISVTASKDCFLYVSTSASMPIAPEIQSVSEGMVTLVSKSGYQYSKDGVNWQSSNVFSNIEYDKVYEFKLKNTSSGAVGESLKFSIASRRNVVVGETKLLVAPKENYEYSIDGVNWQDSNVFENLTKNSRYTVFARMKSGGEIITQYDALGTSDKLDGIDEFETLDATTLVWMRETILDDENILAGDITRDGVVDVRDLMRLKRNMANGQ